MFSGRLVGFLALFLLTVVALADPPASRPATAPTTAPAIKYNGTKRTQAWFDSAYKKYGKNIFVYNDTCWDLGKLNAMSLAYLKSGQVMPELIMADPPQVGEMRLSCPTILSVVNAQELIATVRAAITDDEILIHIKDIDTKGMIDGQAVGDVFLTYLGTYTYTAANSAKKTIQSYGRLAPVSKEGFQLAVAKGIKLVEYRLAAVQPDYHKPDWKKGLIGKGATWFRIVEVPEP